MTLPVSISRVSKGFAAGVATLPVIDGVDLSVAAGEVVALLGPSGCGKSTLLRMIAGLARPDAGTVRIGDRVATQADPRCAVVFQEPRLFAWKTVAANVAVGARRRADRPSPAEWLRLVGLDGFGDRYPHQLSGGMAQRAALARGLIGSPDVLLLDEPFAALDALTRLQMQELLAGICDRLGPTALIVTHDVDEALALADRIVVLSPRPSRVEAVFTLPLPRPRDRSSAVLAPLRAAILACLGVRHGDGRHEASLQASLTPAI